ncbi:S41 family peptidase [Tenacibaculum sp. nBUS_03]|uniref:S41 family peptidase n=1 Tax=Tenacibaculum sp. nBUS_03 TaxID=3395320 RepID=UPI003EBA2A9E
MKARILLLLITLSSIASFGQKLTLEKASPFTAVKWEQDDPIVQFNEQWYSFEKLDHLNKKEILDFCKNEYGHKWKKRFSEDLVEVLNGLQYIPNVEVDLVLSKEGKSKTYKGKFTLSNRDSCLLYNKSNKKKKRIVKNISKAQAIQDLKQFKEVLDSTSSYAQIGNYNYSESLKKLAYAIKNGHTDVSVNWLANEMAKIMSEIGDRHSSIKNKSISKQTIKAMDLRLPFGVTVLDNQLIAVKKTSEKRGYNYYLAKYPYIKSINGITIETLLEIYNYSDKKAPKEARLKRGAYWLERFGHLLYKNNKSVSKKMEVVFTDGELEKKLIVDLTKEKMGYHSNLEKEVYKWIIPSEREDIIKDHNFNQLKRKINNTIGYIKIPMMFHPQEVEGLEHFIKNTLNNFSDTKSLIIDLRYNPGGGRE